MTLEGVGECKGNQKTAKELYLKALKGRPVCVVDAKREERHNERGEPAKEIMEVQLDNNPEHTIQIGTSLS